MSTSWSAPFKVLGGFGWPDVLTGQPARHSSQLIAGHGSPSFGSADDRAANALATGVDGSDSEGFVRQIRACRSLRHREEIGQPNAAAAG